MLSRTCVVLNLHTVPRRLLFTSGIIELGAEQFESPAAKMLLPIDYPTSYRTEQSGGRKCALPTDYKIDAEPIKPEVFLYKGNNSRNRLFFRTSFQLPSGTFTAATFLLDAGLCSHFQLCDELYELLINNVRVIQGGPTDYLKTTINGIEHNCLVQNDLPHRHKPANVIGVPMFFALGLRFAAVDIAKVRMDGERVVRDFVGVEPFKFL